MSPGPDSAPGLRVLNCSVFSIGKESPPKSQAASLESELEIESVGACGVTGEHHRQVIWQWGRSGLQQGRWPASGPLAPAALAGLPQVWRVQDRLPPELPGRGEEGLPPLCPPAQVPRTERSQLSRCAVPARSGLWPAPLAAPSPCALSRGHSHVPWQEDSDATRARAHQMEPSMMSPTPSTTRLPQKVGTPPVPGEARRGALH